MMQITDEMKLSLQEDIKTGPAYLKINPDGTYERVRGQWRTIDSAPKNTKVLAAYQNRLGNWRIVTACYHTQLPWSEDFGDDEQEYAPQGWYEENDSQEVIYPTDCPPTHWMPLPSPPSLQPQEK